MYLGSAGLGERCCVYQWVQPWALLVHWPPADSLPPRSFSQQWNQSGIAVRKQMMNYDDCSTVLVCKQLSFYLSCRSLTSQPKQTFLRAVIQKTSTKLHRSLAMMLCVGRKMIGLKVCYNRKQMTKEFLKKYKTEYRPYVKDGCSHYDVTQGWI